MRDLFKDHEHAFDDCKCCGLNHVCDCGFTQYELSLEKDLAERDEDVRRLKAQMKERHEDYTNTVKELGVLVGLFWNSMTEEQQREWDGLSDGRFEQG